ncbi:MAG: membrane protein insertion efficiency factor YidD [Leptothrix sp. (in: b-proteobacteria)]
MLRADRRIDSVGTDTLAWPARVLTGLVRGYQLLLSPWLGSSCRFEPTCSGYALQALRQHGAATGTRLTVQRILRCHPGCAGGPDPMPAIAPPLFSRLLGVGAHRPMRPAGHDATSSSRKNPP